MKDEWVEQQVGLMTVRDLLCSSDFEHLASGAARNGRVRNLIRDRTVPAQHKMLYLKLRGWEINKARDFYHLRGPQVANCHSLATAYRIQLGYDMTCTLRRFGISPFPYGFYAADQRKLQTQFDSALAAGLLAEPEAVRLQTMQHTDPALGHLVLVWCHYCFRFHQHGMPHEDGAHRVEHCDNGYHKNGHRAGYDLLLPGPNQTLVDVYASLETEIKARRVKHYLRQDARSSILGEDVGHAHHP